YTGLIFVIAVFSFSLGGWVALFHFQVRPHAPFHDLLTNYQRHFRIFCFLVSLILLPFLLVKAKDLASAAGFDNAFIGLRIELSSKSSAGYGILGNASLVSYFAMFLFALGPRNRKENKLYAASIVLSLIYALLSTGRTAFLFLLV